MKRLLRENIRRDERECGNHVVNEREGESDNITYSHSLSRQSTPSIRSSHQISIRHTRFNGHFVEDLPMKNGKRGKYGRGAEFEWIISVERG